MFVIYNILISAFFLLLLPLSLLFIFLKTELVVKEFTGRLGIYPEKFNNYIDYLKKEEIELIWLHAASVGELMMAKCIIEKLVEQYPNIGYIVSTNSSSGMKMAEQLFGQEKTILIPMDLPWITKSLVNKIKPKVTILVEFEAWPNFINYLSKIGSKIVLINGSMDKKIFKYYKIFPGLLKATLNRLDLICMQSEKEKEKIKALGVTHSKIKITGNMKFNNYAKIIDKEEIKGLKDQLKIPYNANIFIAGSTHAGEEEVIFGIYQDINKEISDLVLIIAPRNIERTNKIKRLGEKYKLKMIERSKIDLECTQSIGDQVIILDTIGELADLYAIATIVFVGGSLVNKGGHNILEPVIYGKPVLFGPYIQDFKESADILLENKIGIMVKNENELKNNVLFFLRNGNYRRIITEKARDLFKKEKEASKKNIDILNNILENMI